MYRGYTYIPLNLGMVRDHRKLCFWIRRFVSLVFWLNSVKSRNVSDFIFSSNEVIAKKRLQILLKAVSVTDFRYNFNPDNRVSVSMYYGQVMPVADLKTATCMIRIDMNRKHRYLPVNIA